MNILHVRTVRGSGGGPDKTILKSCEYLNRQDHTARAFYMIDRDHDTGAVVKAAEQLGVTLQPVFERRPVSLATLREFRKTLEAGSFDIIHTHDYKANALAKWYRGRYGYKITATAHGYNPTSFRERIYYGLERWIFKRIDAVVAPTQEMKGRLAAMGIPAGKIHVIPNGIDVTDQPRLERTGRNGRVHLLYLGRFSQEKDIPTLLKAAALLTKDGLDLDLVLAGDGPEQSHLEETIRSLGLSDRVTMPGYVTDVNPLLARADVLVNPSRTECMPNVILEAMWSGVPVVATAVGGVSEMLRDGIEGLLCPPQNPEALAGTIKRLAADPAFAETLAANAYRRLVEEFTFEKHMNATLDLYRRVTKED